MATTYHTKSHCKYMIKLHMIFVTKYRKNLLDNGLEEDLKQIMFGVYEDESIKNPAALKQIQMSTKEIWSKIELHPEEQDPEDQQWHIRYIKIEQSEINILEQLFQQNMWDGWYALLWDNEEVRVILTNGTRRMPNNGNSNSPAFDNRQLGEVSEIAKQNNLDDNYMIENLSKAMDEFRSNAAIHLRR